MEQYSNSAARQLFNAGSGIGRWARLCLDALAEDMAGAGRSRREHCATIEVSEAGTRITLRDRAGSATTIGETRPDLIAAATSALPARARKDVLLRFSGGRVIRQRIVLPAAAEDVLAAVVRNKVESLAPWPLAEVMWGYRPAPSPSPGQIAVDVGIVGRKPAEALTTALTASGVRVQGIELARHGEAAIEIDMSGPRRAGAIRRTITACLALLGFGTLAAGGHGAYLAYNQQKELWALDRQHTELRQSLLGRAGGGSGDPRLAAANLAYERRKAAMPAVALLNEVTARVPDGVWLTGLDYDNGRLTLSGKGQNIDKVIESLDAGEAFSDVNFASATQRDAELDADSFVISAVVAAGSATP